MNLIKTFITIPVHGQPFIEAEIHKNNTEQIMEHLHTATESTSVQVIKVPVVIHPMFVAGNPRWAIVDNLLKEKQGVNVWTVTDYMDYSSNMATVLSNPRHHRSGCPHLMGCVILEVSAAAMAKWCPDADVLRTIEVPDDATEDDESVAAYEAMAAAKGYDTSRWETCGQVFVKAA